MNVKMFAQIFAVVLLFATVCADGSTLRLVTPEVDANSAGAGKTQMILM